MENNEQVDNADDLKKPQENLVDQELLDKISKIDAFYKKFIDNKIDENTDNFTSWWNGDKDDSSFADCEKRIKETMEKCNIIDNKTKDFENLESKYSKEIKEIEFIKNGKSVNLENLESQYAEKITELEKKIDEIEIIKKDLHKYRNEVVLGTLFETFKQRSVENLEEAKIFSKNAIFSLLGALITLFALVIFSHFFDIKEFYVFSMLILFITLSMFCSNKSKIYHKLAEEYAHKATFLESFVGYDEEFKKYLGNKYNDLFDKVTDAVSSNPSDKIDKFLQFRYPWEKIVDVGKKIADKVANNSN